MVKIAPSLLSADFTDLRGEISRVPNADWLHVDVMDGHFVPNITIGVPVVKSLRACTDFFLDVHLMIDRPQRYIEAFARAGADLLSVHVESDTPAGIRRALRLCREEGVKRGVVLKPGTDAQAVLPYLEEGLDLVLIMTVEPGFGGQSFLEEQLCKVSQVRALLEERCPSCLLEVDGGINPRTAPRAISAGANVLVAGSAVFAQSDPAAAVEALRGGR